MANNQTNSPLVQLKSFLNKLFQFESQDLDFGVYKILNYKQKEIKEFIERLLDEDAAETLQKELKDKTITARLWETKDEQTFLLKKLHHYTRKNKYDFFIHKNLKAFL